MGITGLLPLLEKGNVSRPSNIKEFAGCTVAADAYCWLHKGAFSCADKLARGEETDMYVQYCMKYVNMLLSHDIKPILVFDGRHLPAKAETEKKRRQKREENRKQAANLLRQGNTAEALSFMRRCVDVTHKMAVTLMKECRKRNVDCIVAPYEADAQLAFFSIEGIADLIITEDSDLLLFGCRKVMFKLDLVGNGILVENDRLHQAMGIRPEAYSFDKFRYMCVLSGCDYLDSLPGIGLGKACKFITRTQDPDIHKALSRLPSQLNIRGLTVSMEYRDEFMKADAMFKHQLVFDPRSRKPRPLTPHKSVHPGSPLASGPLPGCVPEFDDDTSYQLALGNLDPFKVIKVDDYDPDAPRTETTEVKTTGWSQVARAPHPSIWDVQFMDLISKRKPKVAPSFLPNESRPATKGKTLTIDTGKLVNKESRKRAREDDEEPEVNKKQALVLPNLTALYSSGTPCTPSAELIRSPCNSEDAKVIKSPTSPILSNKRPSRNPFARSPQCSSSKKEPNTEDLGADIVSPTEPTTTPKSEKPRKFGALSKFARATQRTVTDGKPVVHSRYFGSSVSLDTPSQTSEASSEVSPQGLLRDVSNTIQEEDQEKERVMLQGYSLNTSKAVHSAMVHRKPLFSFSNFKSSKDNESENTNSCDVRDSLHSKFGAQTGHTILNKSPSKNPFKKQPIERYEDKHEEQSPQYSVPTNIYQGSRTEEEDVDDPGFESGTSSVSQLSSSSTSMSPKIEKKSSILLDEGIGSPLDAASKPPFKASGPSPKGNVKSCRAQGLRKVASSGQSTLSAFGFIPKAKLQR